MSGKRLHSIITAVKEKGEWSGRASGWQLRIQKCSSETFCHLIHWYATRGKRMIAGDARTVKDAIEFCEREKQLCQS